MEAVGMATGWIYSPYAYTDRTSGSPLGISLAG
jgi:hypothetical protein